eukprot:TRINITY_DN4205_c0_g1_i1.p1 TRINITY_DN4205_c0_g1~~TRINITY_DN4205_c0_g1_i1.p1  ORF type:complete len:388 (-),score=68.04 TRINITY_DN4205_c0_g1_i1:146-1309(-)
MCLLAIALNEHPDFPFIICSNRDEFLSRGSNVTPPRVDPSTSVLSVIDKQGLGTWLGVNVREGHFAVLTNIGGTLGKISRGQLVNDFVTRPSETLLTSRFEYGGFNILWGNIFDQSPVLHYSNNRDPDDPDLRVDSTKPAKKPKVTTLKRGIFGLGNELLGDEIVKVPYVENLLRKVISATPRSSQTFIEEETIEQLRDNLASLLQEQNTSLRTDFLDSPKNWTNFFLKFATKTRANKRQIGFDLAVKAFFTLLTARLFLGLLLHFIIGEGGSNPVVLFDFSLGFFLRSCLLPLVLGFFFGLVVYYRMQSILVQKIPFFQYGTVAHTIVFTTRTGQIHYYYCNRREVSTALNSPSDWDHFRFDFQVDDQHQARTRSSPFEISNAHGS